MNLERSSLFTCMAVAAVLIGVSSTAGLAWSAVRESGAASNGEEALSGEEARRVDDAAAIPGLDIRSDDVARAIEKFEGGAKDEAIEDLNQLLKDSSVKSDPKRRAEVNCGLAIIKIRSGNYSGANRHIGGLLKDKDRSIAGRARLIMDISKESGNKASATKPKKSVKKDDAVADSDADAPPPPLASRSDWLDAVSRAADRAMGSIDDSLNDTNEAIDGRNWNRIPERLKNILNRVWEIRSVDLDRERRRSEVDQRLSRVRGFITKLESVREQLTKDLEAERELGRLHRNPRGSRDEHESNAKTIEREHIPGCDRTMKQIEDLDRNTR
jgi:hypothetical protein